MRTARCLSPFLIVLCSLPLSLIGCSSSEEGTTPGVDSGKQDSGQDTGTDTNTPDTTSDDTGDDATVDSDQPDTTGDDATVNETGDDAADSTAAETSDDAADSGASDDAADSTTTDTADATDSADSTVDDADAADSIADSIVDSTVDDADAADSIATDTGVGDTSSDAADTGPTAPTAFYVLRLGDGAAALTNASTAGFLEKHSLTDGALVGAPIALPTAASGSNQPITFAGTASSEGALTTSVDGRFVVLAGYAVAPGTTSIATSTTVSRVVARVDAAGTVDTTTTLGTTAYMGSNVRSAASVDGSSFWVGGTASPAAGGGVWYATLGSTSATQVLASPSNVRAIGIFGGQLYGDSGSSGYTTAFAVGTGTPTMAGATATLLPGGATTGASPYGFALFDRNASVAGLDTLYLCDDRAVPSGGIQKWTFDGTTWTLGTTFGLGIGCRGLAAYTSGANVTLIATTADATLNKVVMLVDDGSATPTVTTWATAAMNTMFRGVAIAP